MSDTVWILSVTHKHGTNVSAHRNEEGALAGLASYVVGEWAQEMPNRMVMPENEGDAISAYFTSTDHHGETYALDEVQLQD